MTVRDGQDGARGVGRTAARVRIVLPEALRELAGGRAVVEVEVGEEAGAVGSGRAGVGAGAGVVGAGRAGIGAGAAGGAPGPVADAPNTVGGLLAALSASHPGLYDRLMTEQGLLRPHVNLFVDGENIRFTGGLETGVDASSEILVLPAISGG